MDFLLKVALVSSLVNNKKHVFLDFAFLSVTRFIVFWGLDNWHSDSPVVTLRCPENYPLESHKILLGDHACQVAKAQSPAELLVKVLVGVLLGADLLLVFAGDYLILVV